MKKRRLRGIESLKSKYGYMFVSIWVIGFVLFFATPLIQSVIYSLSDVVIGGETSFAGIKHFKMLLTEDPDSHVACYAVESHFGGTEQENIRYFESESRFGLAEQAGAG